MIVVKHKIDIGMGFGGFSAVKMQVLETWRNL